MKTWKFNIGNISKFTVCFLILALLLTSFDADAQRRRRRASTTSSASSGNAAPASGSSSSATSSNTSRSSRRTQRTQSITEATQNAAKGASGSARQRSSKNNSKTSKSNLAFVVEKPDLEAIRKATLNSKHKYYYPTLWEKYNRKDTTAMTPEEFRHLYLGYMFQEDYDPFREGFDTSVADSIRLKIGKTELTREEKEIIKTYAEKALKNNPFDLRQMSYLVQALNLMEKKFTAGLWEYRLKNILGAIKSTGTGLSQDNAFFVIYPMHEYDMLQLLGYTPVDAEYQEPGFDYIKVKPDGSEKIKKPASGFYFNVQVPQQQYELKHPENPDIQGAGDDDTEDEGAYDNGEDEGDEEE